MEAEEAGRPKRRAAVVESERLEPADSKVGLRERSPDRTPVAGLHTRRGRPKEPERQSVEPEQLEERSAGCMLELEPGAKPVESVLEVRPVEPGARSRAPGWMNMEPAFGALVWSSLLAAIGPVVDRPELGQAADKEPAWSLKAAE